MSLTKERIGEICLLLVQACVADEIELEKLTPENAEKIVQEILDANPDLLTQLGIDKNEIFELALAVVPDEETKETLEQAIERIAGIMHK